MATQITIPRLGWSMDRYIPLMAAAAGVSRAMAYERVGLVRAKNAPRSAIGSRVAITAAPAVMVPRSVSTTTPELDSSTSSTVVDSCSSPPAFVIAVASPRQ